MNQEIFYESAPGYHAMRDWAKSKEFEFKSAVTGEQIENIIVDALECTSNYWVGLDNTTPEWDSKPKDLPSSMYAVQMLFDGKSVKLFDIEDEDVTWELTMDKLLSGIARMIKEGNSISDAEDNSDMTLQYALFGEIVYG